MKGYTINENVGITNYTFLAEYLPAHFMLIKQLKQNLLSIVLKSCIFWQKSCYFKKTEKDNGINKNFFSGSAIFPHCCAIPSLGGSLLQDLFLQENLLSSLQTHTNHKLKLKFGDILYKNQIYQASINIVSIFFYMLQLWFCSIIFAIVYSSYSASKFKKALLKIEIGRKPHGKKGSGESYLLLSD